MELSAQLVAKRDTKGEAKGYKENDMGCRFLGVWKPWEVSHELILGRELKASGKSRKVAVKLCLKEAPQGEVRHCLPNNGVSLLLRRVNPIDLQ